MKWSSKPKQHTDALMLPVNPDRAEFLAGELTQDDLDAQALIELVCGIAAIEDAAARQRTAYAAMSQAYLQTANSQTSMLNYVAGIYKERLAQ
jgi:hypothetical protein